MEKEGIKSTERGPPVQGSDGTADPHGEVTHKAGDHTTSSVSAASEHTQQLHGTVQTIAGAENTVAKDTGTGRTKDADMSVVPAAKSGQEEERRVSVQPYARLENMMAQMMNRITELEGRRTVPAITEPPTRPTAAKLDEELALVAPRNCAIDNCSTAGELVGNGPSADRLYTNASATGTPQRHQQEETAPRSSMGITLEAGRSVDQAPSDTWSVQSSGDKDGTEGTVRIGEKKWTEGMKEILTTIKLPQIPLPSFSGTNREEYSAFIEAFHRYIGDHDIPEPSRLQFLIRACNGRLRTTLESYNKLGPVKGYTEALRMLEKRLGTEEDHVEDMVRSLRKGPQVNGDDSEALRKMKDDIWDCIIHMENRGRKNEIDTHMYASEVAERFTGKLRDRYEDEFQRYKKKNKHRPGIEWLKTFVDDANERFDINGKRKEPSNDLKQDATGQSKNALSFATTSGQTTTTDDEATKDGKRRLSCLVCDGDHPVQRCEKFRRMTAADRREVVRRAQACYNCLARNHIAAECWTKTRCDVQGCQRRHSRWLHLTTGEDRRPRGRKGAFTRDSTSVSKGPKMDDRMNKERRGRGSPSRTSDRRDGASSCYYTSTGRESRDERPIKRERMEKHQETDEPEGPSNKRSRRAGSETQ